MTTDSNKYYSTQQLKDISEGYDELPRKFQKLYERFIVRSYTSEKAREYATHGFARRLKILFRCIVNVFNLLPPDADKDKLPNDEQLLDASINIQASIINIFGSIDNLAWIWVTEKNLMRANGKSLSKFDVGLSSKCTDVRESFSKEFHDYLKTVDKWFDGIGDYRDALAHRIPLYIPPSCLAPERGPAYSELEKKMEEAVKRSNFDEYDRLGEEQRKLMVFQPLIQHSFGEGATPIVFHYQLLTNFATVEEVATKLLEELDQPAKNAN